MEYVPGANPVEELLVDNQAVENDHFFTVPTLGMTLPRLVASPVIAYRAIRGKPTAKLIFAAAASDAEGFLARGIDKFWPNSGLGSSKAGAELDYGADAALVAGTSTADMLGMHSHPATRVSGLLTSLRVADQVRWAKPAMAEYKQVTGHRLHTKVGMVGKCATASTLLAAGLNAISRDMPTDTPELRELRGNLAYSALGASFVGLVLGHIAIGQNDRQFKDKLATFESASTSQSS